MSGSECPARLGDQSTDQPEGESGGHQRRGPNGGFALSTRDCGGEAKRDGCSASFGSNVWLHRRTPPRQAHPGLLLDESTARRRSCMDVRGCGPCSAQPHDSMEEKRAPEESFYQHLAVSEI